MKWIIVLLFVWLSLVSFLLFKHTTDTQTAANAFDHQSLIDEHDALRFEIRRLANILNRMQSESFSKTDNTTQTQVHSDGNASLAHNTSSHTEQTARVSYKDMYQQSAMTDEGSQLTEQVTRLINATPELSVLSYTKIECKDLGCRIQFSIPQDQFIAKANLITSFIMHTAEGVSFNTSASYYDKDLSFGDIYFMNNPRTHTVKSK